jgi:hypothetical protein
MVWDGLGLVGLGRIALGWVGIVWDKFVGYMALGGLGQAGM